jgi:hypothetical protein
MRKSMLFFILTLQVIFLYGELAEDEYLVFDIYQNKTFELGDRLSKIIDVYPNVLFIGETKYSNIIYKEYKYRGIIFSISAHAESERNARVRKIEIISKEYSTKRNISIGCTQDDVLRAYGNADYTVGNKMIYMNTEYDHMELVFNIDENEIVKTIVLVVGT